MGYTVPNFGPQSNEIAETYSSLSKTEEKLGHKWNWSKAGASNKKDYFVPQFGMDQDVKDSLSNLKSGQATLGTWDLPKDDWFIQTNATETREPLATWSPSSHKLGFKADYFVPNFGGQDEDISNTQKNINNLEVKFPAFVQVDAEMEREPLLTWSPSSHKSFKKDYFVPNFGPKDADITTTYGDLDLAEKNLGHKWNWSKAGASNKKDYFIPNFGRDSDVNDSIKNLNEAQGTLGTWDLPKDDWF